MYFLRLDFTLELREFLIVKNHSFRRQNHGPVLSLTVTEIHHNWIIDKLPFILAEL